MTRAVVLSLTLIAALAAGFDATGAIAPPALLPAKAALARDVDRVESVRAVKRLQFAFAQYVDAGDWDKAAALFTDEGQLADGRSDVHGRGAISAYLQGAFGHGSPGLAPQEIHTPIFMAPIATLSDDGDTARVRWHGIALTGGLNRSADWAGGIYENVYVREHGVWKIARIDYHPFLAGPYRSGWSSPSPELPLVPYHFKPSDLGKPVVQEIAPAAGGAAPRPLAARVQALQDEDAVRNLQNAYGYYIDRKMWNDVVDLFEPDATFSIAGVGDYLGAVGVRRALERDGPQGLRYGEMNDRIQANTVVSLDPDGEHARARGLELGMIGKNDGPAFWSVVVFDNLYVKRSGVWRVQTMRQLTRMRTAHALGWARSWLSDSPPPPQFAPDRATPSPFPDPWVLEHPSAPKSVAQSRTLRDTWKVLWAAAAQDAIENLAGAYGQYLDDGQWDDLAYEFAAQGERDSAGGGFIRTPARIASISKSRYGSYNPHRSLTSMHIRTQPVIDVGADGRTAQERTRLFQLFTGPADTPPAKHSTGMIMTGSYEDDIVFENGEWKFKRVDLDHLLYTLDYAHGWTRIPEGTGKLLDPPLGAIAGIKFDSPGMGDTYPPFPKVGHMWFHYRNPVSGRAPQYLMPKYELPEP